MSRRKQHSEEAQAESGRKVEVVGDRTIINGHVLPAGAVVSLSEGDIDAHRNAGVALIDVSDDDEREVHDVSEAYVSPEGPTDGNENV